jgi:hypothetical protein
MEFRYDAALDEYCCPAGQRAIWHFKTIEHGQTIHKHLSSACPENRDEARGHQAARLEAWENEGGATADHTSLRLRASTRSSTSSGMPSSAPTLQATSPTSMRSPEA